MTATQRTILLTALQQQRPIVVNKGKNLGKMTADAAFKNWQAAFQDEWRTEGKHTLRRPLSTAHEGP